MRLKVLMREKNIYAVQFLDILGNTLFNGRWVDKYELSRMISWQPLIGECEVWQIPPIGEYRRAVVENYYSPDIESIFRQQEYPFSSSHF